MAKKKRRSGRSGNPAKAAAPARPLGPRPQRLPTTPASDTRRALERWSAPVILTLNRLPRLLVPILLAVVLVAGLLVPNGIVGGLLLLVVGAFLAWLVALSWPVIAGAARLIRVVTVVAVVGIAVLRLTGRF